ncbi:MAG: sugar phosphate nucleotidyltransferase [Candidatus Colwellbacteria bacterium]|nr:sugar phosphate nucleotidyltransferase [Candidatus Colwellbacteria bacterium]
MQAVILAAGEGKRLRPLTNDLPKPMVRVNGKPILEYTLGILPENISEVILVVGYQKEKIIKYFGNSFNGLPIKYVVQETPLGTAHALDIAKAQIKDGFFLFMYGDDLYHQDDLKALVGLETPAILVKESKHPERYGVCLTDNNGCLTGVLEKHPEPPSNLVNIGVYLLNQEIFGIPRVQLPNGEFNLAEQIGSWATKRQVRVIQAKFWHPIGYPEDVEAADSLVTLSTAEKVN